MHILTTSYDTTIDFDNVAFLPVLLFQHFWAFFLCFLSCFKISRCACESHILFVNAAFHDIGISLIPSLPHLFPLWGPCPFNQFFHQTLLIELHTHPCQLVCLGVRQRVRGYGGGEFYPLHPLPSISVAFVGMRSLEFEEWHFVLRTSITWVKILKSWGTSFSLSVWKCEDSMLIPVYVLVTAQTYYESMARHYGLDQLDFGFAEGTIPFPSWRQIMFCYWTNANIMSLDIKELSGWEKHMSHNSEHN